MIKIHQADIVFFLQWLLSGEQTDLLEHKGMNTRFWDFKIAPLWCKPCLHSSTRVCRVSWPSIIRIIHALDSWPSINPTKFCSFKLLEVNWSFKQEKLKGTNTRNQNIDTIWEPLHFLLPLGRVSRPKLALIWPRLLKCSLMSTSKS